MVRAGVSYSGWPIIAPMDVNDVTVKSAGVFSGKLGLGARVILSEKWRATLGGHSSTALASRFGTMRSHYDIDGYFQLERSCFTNWAIGVDWRGEVLESKFASADLNGQTQLFQSTAALYFARNF